MDKDIFQLKVENFISLRASIINILIVLVGGIVSLFFLPVRSFTYVFGGVGFFYFFVFLSNLIGINSTLDRLLNNKKENKYE